MSEKDKVGFKLSALNERQFNFFNEKYRMMGSFTKTIRLIMDIFLNRDVKEYEETKTLSSKPLKKGKHISFRLSALDERQILCWNEAYNRTHSIIETIKEIIEGAIRVEKVKEINKIDDEEIHEPEETEKEVIGQVKRKKKSQAEIMFEIINALNLEFFRDYNGILCVYINGEKHYWDSKFIKRFMHGKYTDETRKVCSDRDLNVAHGRFIYLFEDAERERIDEKEEKKQIKKIDFTKSKKDDIRGLEIVSEMDETIYDLNDKEHEQFHKLAMMLDVNKIKPFRNKEGITFIQINGKNHNVDSSFVKDWMYKIYSDKYKDESLSEKALKLIISTIKEYSRMTEEERDQRYKEYHERIRTRFKLMTQLLADEKINPFRDVDGFIYIWIEGAKRKYDSGFVKDWMRTLHYDNVKVVLNDEVYRRLIDTIKHDVEIKEKEDAKKHEEEEIRKKKRGRPKCSENLFKIAEEAFDYLFTDEFGDEYIRYKGKIIRFDKKEGKLLLRKMYRERTGNIAGINCINETFDEVIAKCSDYKIKLYTRVAPDELGGFWIDLADGHNRAVHITKNGWEDTDYPPLLFRPNINQKALPIPKKGGSIDDLFKYINIKEGDDKMIVKTVSLHYLIPEIPHIGQYWYGQTGSAKTVGQNIIKRYIDPSIANTLEIKEDTLSNYLVYETTILAVVDNVSKLSKENQDCISKAITGAADLDRELFYNKRKKIFKCRLSFLMNGISMVAYRPDYLSRFFIIEVPDIEKENRISEEHINDFLDENDSKIFGAVLDRMVKALNIYPKIKEKISEENIELDRMIDAQVWCCAISEAMGVDFHRFLEAWNRKRRKQYAILVMKSIIGRAITYLVDRQAKVEGCPEWKGSVQNLFIDTKAEAKNVLGQDMRSFPRDASKFQVMLDYIELPLTEIGYKVTRWRKGIHEMRKITKIMEFEDIEELRKEYVKDKKVKKDDKQKRIEEYTKHDERKEELDIVYKVIAEAQKLTGRAKAETVFGLLLEPHKIDKVKAEEIINELIENKRILKTEEGDYKTIDDSKEKIDESETSRDEDGESETSRDESDESETGKTYNMKTFKVDEKKEKKKRTVQEELDIVLKVISENQLPDEQGKTYNVETFGIEGIKAEKLFDILWEDYEIDVKKAEKLIEILKREGRIYEPRIGYYKVIR